MVYVPGRKANGAKLPSEGLGLNASKSESRPNMQRYVLCLSRGKASLRIPVGAWTRWRLARLNRSGDKPERYDQNHVSDFEALEVDTISNCGMSVRAKNRL